MTTSISRTDAGMAANLKHIVVHGVRDNPVPQSSTSVTRGFEKTAFPKIVRELGDSQLIVRQKALLAAQELLGSPVNHIQCIAAGITPAVVNLLQDEDALIRERAASTALTLAKREIGARDLIQYGGVSSLVPCLHDEVMAVRSAAYEALHEAALYDPVRKELTALQALVTLMNFALIESHERAMKGLRILNACVQMRDNGDALTQLIEAAKAIPHVVGLLVPGKPVELQEQAALLLSMLTSQFLNAKVAAVEVNAVPHLIELMGSKHTGLACAAAAALMMITVVREGKYAVVDTAPLGGFQKVVSALNPTKPQLCTDAMQLICNIAEAPEARELLEKAGAPQRLADIHLNKSYREQLSRSAGEAIRQCRFKCFPGEHAKIATELEQQAQQ